MTVTTRLRLLKTTPMFPFKMQHQHLPLLRLHLPLKPSHQLFPIPHRRFRRRHQQNLINGDVQTIRYDIQ